MTTTERIDVTVLEPRMKHPTIFKMFDTLNEGESFLIYNDHDPKPLYYQLLGERGNIFTWEYIENGPLNWQVKIRKNISYKEPTIGEIVAGDHRTAEVFKKFNIDFCCGGKKTLSEACSEKHINKSDVEVELNNLTEQTKTASQDYTNWPLDFLVDYIVNTHHNYVKNAIPILLSYTEKVAKVHGKTNEEVITVHQLFKEAAEELNNHMMKEENVLFPYIKQMVKNSAKQDDLHCTFGTIKNPVRMMEHEHDEVGELFKTIRALTSNYTPPKEACTTYKLSYLKLQEFEQDLHEHIHLENNILFPKSISFETKLTS